MTNKDNHINRYGEGRAHAAQGVASRPAVFEDEYGMQREQEETDLDWSHDPRSESAREKHYGKGPKNWLTDESIKYKVSLALYLTPEVDATKIEVQVEQGRVTLSGPIRDRKQKKAAEECIDTIPGVSDIFNKLVIQ
ncbi:MAG: BON domain-containing protein [Bdellovibrionales bacterium]|nr:BON domain-containing protein [Bdellovibrionales bacterium]